MKTVPYILSLVLLVQERPYQGNLPRDNGRVCAPVVAQRDAFEQRAREAEELLAQARGRIAALQLQLLDIPAAQVELWRVVDELRLVRAERDDLKRVAQNYAALLREFNADFESQEEKIRRMREEAAFWQNEAMKAEIRNTLQKRKR